MRAYDIILKKREGGLLHRKEIQWMIQEYVAGKLPDYQMAAFLMAVYFQGLTEEETLFLTLAVANSGDQIDLSAIHGVKVDKHSTGGVGDKTTLIVAPIVACCGVPVAKMSGRGLGHTGGTIDKLESIPGFQTSISTENFFEIVNRTGICIIGQTANLAPADKKMYALRDVTATVDSIPLIAASIMSKKLAAGADAIVLDVKKGSGAFMKTIEDAIQLAETMVKIGQNAGRRMLAVITDMDHPLGNAIGNSLEVIEAIETLKGKGPEDLTELAMRLSAYMLQLAGRGNESTCMELVTTALKNGAALKKLEEMIAAQSGDIRCIEDYTLFPQSRISYRVSAPREGFITKIDTEECGKASVLLGAGRKTKESTIDYGAGILLRTKIGGYVRKGEEMAVLLTNDSNSIEEAESILLQALHIGNEKPPRNPLICAVVNGENRVQMYPYK